MDVKAESADIQNDAALTHKPDNVYVPYFHRMDFAPAEAAIGLDLQPI